MKIENKIKNETHRAGAKGEGIFEEIWCSIGDISKIKDIKVGHLDKADNIIDLQLSRNNHEFDIVIDEEGIGIIVDDEMSDNPLEEELPISELKNIENFWEWLNDFVESNS